MWRKSTGKINYIYLSGTLEGRPRQGESSGYYNRQDADPTGGPRRRSYWHCFSDDTKAIVYVVDAADRARLGLTRRELHSLLDADEFRNAKLLVLANKQDLAGAASPAEVTEALALDTLRDRSWTIVPTVATEGEGIEEGMDWYVMCINGPT